MNNYYSGLEQQQMSYSQALQNYQVQVSEATTKKSEDLIPAEMLGGEFLKGGLTKLGSKISTKTGLKSLRNLGKEPLSKTLQNTAKEAAQKAKDFTTDAVKKRLGTTKNLINKQLKDNGFDGFTDEEFSNLKDSDDMVSALSSKINDAQKVKKALSEPTASATKTATTETASATETAATETAATETGTSTTLKDIDLTPGDVDTLKDILGRYVGEDYRTRTFELGDNAVRSGAAQAVTDTPQPGGSLLAKVLNPKAEPFTMPSAPEPTLAPISEPTPPPVAPASVPEPAPSVPASVPEPVVPTSEPVAASVPEPVVPVTEEEGGTDDILDLAGSLLSNAQKASGVADDALKTTSSGIEDGIQSATKALGAADIASGGLDLFGDIAEVGLGVLGTFLPSILGGGGSSVKPPSPTFEASQQIGVTST